LASSIRLRAFAKVNLALKILGRRQDGYHEIRTVAQTLALHDCLQVTLTPEPGIYVHCTDALIPSGRGNLVYKACRVWRAARKYSGGIRVALEKHIPAGSGLGGGSSDAAATLLGLEKLSGNLLDPTRLFRLAASIGSDVPLFLVGGRVLACGRGEEVYPLSDLPKRRCLVIYPGFRISTEEAYREASFRLTRVCENPRVKKFGVWSLFSPANWGPAENDFEQVAFAKWPELENLKNQFIRAGAETVCLTGSGSAVYVIYDSARQLNLIPSGLPQAWVVFRTRTLGRREYHRLLVEA
jgi:4-diphosphocytidyl-2-C-methyl-D-erythritol kinase